MNTFCGEDAECFKAKASFFYVVPKHLYKGLIVRAKLGDSVAL
jgi:hypothetical protein